VHGAALGVIGFGRIGRAVARRAQGFDMTVLSTADTPLEELLATSDFVSLHCPLTPDIRHLINSAALRRMRPSAILLNTARGGVDQAAPVDAPQHGVIAGAAIDVTDPEPPPPADPIFTTPNLIVAPHVGSATRSARARMTEPSVEDRLAGLAGEPMPHPSP
jgi:phosphoglycerate dehydrogenase-like enzyme